MIELVKSTDVVRISYLKGLLEAAGLHPVLVEASAYPGVLPSRIQVPDDEAAQGRRLIVEVDRDLR